MTDNNQSTTPPPRIIPNTERGLQPARNPPPMPKTVPPKSENSN